MEEGDRWGWWIFVGCCLGFVIFSVAHGLAASPGGTPPAWFGSAGIFGTLIGLGTLLAAIAAGGLAFRSYRMNLDIGAANRFQKAADLIGSSSEISQVGGIWTALDVAKQFPARYLAPAVTCLQAFIRKDASVRETALHPMGMSPVDLPATGSAHLQAIVACTHVPNADRWPDAFPKRRVQLLGCYFSKVTLVGLNFTGIDLEGAILSDARFERCTFKGSKIQGIVHGTVTFEDCDLGDSTIEVTDRNKKVSPQWAASVDIIGGKADGGTLNGTPI